ncbi:hypothetical protein DOE76_13925 [Leifsonia sp. ku-ls]|nr:hypothetical protein DOE76_13925 [Leifsonia sp. ku-ls]
MSTKSVREEIRALIEPLEPDLIYFPEDDAGEAVHPWLVLERASLTSRAPGVVLVDYTLYLVFPQGTSSDEQDDTADSLTQSLANAGISWTQAVPGIYSKDFPAYLITIQATT